MIVEERVYTLQSGKAAEFVNIYAGEGLAVHNRHLPKMLGFFTTEVGPLNQVVHLWAYASFEERMRCRTAAQTDPDWAPCGARLRQLIVTQENKLLLPTAFSPKVELPSRS
jgi:hypothetical protein